jgi:hypothetical protein
MFVHLMASPIFKRNLKTKSENQIKIQYLSLYLKAMKENRVKIKQLCETAGTYSIAAKLITSETQRRLSVDAIKSWTCNPDSSRARTCPDWAIIALEKRLQNLQVAHVPTSQTGQDKSSVVHI